MRRIESARLLPRAVLPHPPVLKLISCTDGWYLGTVMHSAIERYLSQKGEGGKGLVESGDETTNELLQVTLAFDV